MSERDELVQVAAEALVSALGPDDGTYTCDCTTERCPAIPCPTAVTVRDAAAAAVVEALGEWLAAAWDEGFTRGFYSAQAMPRDADASESSVANPYTTDERTEDR